MFESCALASAFLFVFWYGDDDPAIGAVSATVLGIASSVLGWSFWVALGAAVGLGTRDSYQATSWLAMVGAFNVAQAIGLLLVFRGLPLVA